MNIVLFGEDEIGIPICASDRRVRHVVKVLGRKSGEPFKAGIIGNSVGTASISAIDGEMFSFSYEETGKPDPLAPIVLFLGFPRPIQANRIFKDASALGVSRIILFGTELGEKSYRESGFFSKGEYTHALIEGAEQAGTSSIPSVDTGWSLESTLGKLDQNSYETKNFSRIALDPYKAVQSFGHIAADAVSKKTAGLVVAIGSERGWTGRELDLLEQSGFAFSSIGKRILKTETACTVSIGIALEALGLM